MAIHIEIVAPNGAVVKHHSVQKIEMFGAFATIILSVHSFTDASAEAIGGMAQWCWSLSFAPDELRTMGRDGAEELLISSTQSPFVGGAVIEGLSELESRICMKQIQLKSARDQQDFGGFEWNGHRFDSNQISQQRIGLAIQEAMFCISVGIPFSRDWTLEDNSVLTLTGNDMVAVGLAMGQHIGTAHEKYRLLKQQLAAASTPGEVAAINW
jgi:hypothetical protein